jgi:fumarate reductase flavoprotein subunit
VRWKAHLPDAVFRLWERIRPGVALPKYVGSSPRVRGTLVERQRAGLCVLSRQGAQLPNLFAAGGAAAGVSASQASGYLSGNGLLTATVLVPTFLRG